MRDNNIHSCDITFIVKLRQQAITSLGIANFVGLGIANVELD